jgi:hypothetical protein
MVSQLPDNVPDREDPKAVPPAERQRADRPDEFGGRDGPEPTRYGDWEKNGRCIDF